MAARSFANLVDVDMYYARNAHVKYRILNNLKRCKVHTARLNTYADKVILSQLFSNIMNQHRAPEGGGYMLQAHRITFFDCFR